MVNVFCANMQLYFSGPLDSSHLDTCGSISQVIEHLPQPNRTSRYTSVGGNLFTFNNRSILLSVLLPHPKDKWINLIFVN